MATIDKDFKVKNGLQVAGTAYIAGNMSAGSVTEDSHAATKEYIDNLVFAEVSDTAPSSLYPGKMWIDTTESRLKIYTGSSWTTVASKADADHLQDHIHDDAIEGSGQVIQVFE